MIAVPFRVATATLDILRACGAGRRECIAFWTCPIGTDVVREVIHPRHAATWAGCEVDGAWATSFFLGLSDRRERTIAQVHTHPGSGIEHSVTDDVHILVPSAGFVSIVIPHFAQRHGRAGWGIWRLDEDGTWIGAAEAITWLTD